MMLRATESERDPHLLDTASIKSADRPTCAFYSTALADSVASAKPVPFQHSACTLVRHLMNLCIYMHMKQ